jgi:hypothetical protein
MFSRAQQARLGLVAISGTSSPKPAGHHHQPRDSSLGKWNSQVDWMRTVGLYVEEFAERSGGSG